MLDGSNTRFNHYFVTWVGLCPGLCIIVHKWFRILKKKFDGPIRSLISIVYCTLVDSRTGKSVEVRTNYIVVYVLPSDPNTTHRNASLWYQNDARPDSYKYLLFMHLYRINRKENREKSTVFVRLYTAWRRHCGEWLRTLVSMEPATFTRPRPNFVRTGNRIGCLPSDFSWEKSRDYSVIRK